MRRPVHRDLIDGGDGDDFIVGNQGNDTLIGGDGADTIIGGSGVDQITGGRATTSSIWSAAATTLSITPAYWTATTSSPGFDANNDNGTDQLNLDALFDTRGVAVGDRADRVQIDDPGGAGGTVEIRDTNGDATFGLHVATITTTTANPLAVGTEIIVS